MRGVRRDAQFEAAFAELYPRARRLASRIVGRPAVADDIAAEALARAFADWKRLQAVDYLDAWVLRVTTNLALNVVKRKEVLVDAPPPTSPEDAAAVRLGLVAALLALPRRQREAVALYYLGDMSEADVGRALGIAPGTVKTHVHRGLAALRAQLDGEEDSIAFAV